jgi:hypothetical protein
MTSVLWRSEALADLPVLVRESRPGETCGIFHLDIPDVDVDGVGPAWLEDRPYDTAELPCGHVFHACALAVHCLANDMRCPVCRAGLPDKAQVSGFAPAMQPALLAKKLALHGARDDAENDAAFNVDLDVDAIARELCLEIYMQWAPPSGQVRRANRVHRDLYAYNVARIETPLHLTDDARLAEHLDNYTTHRSFQRRFNRYFRGMQSSGNIMCLGLSHPLLSDPVRSTLFDKASLLSFAETATSIPLSHNIGFVLPVRTDYGIQLTVHLNTSYICMTCIQTMVDLDSRLRL